MEWGGQSPNTPNPRPLVKQLYSFDYDDIGYLYLIGHVFKMVSFLVEYEALLNGALMTMCLLVDKDNQMLKHRWKYA